ncbi:MAG: hypothetical protein V4675_12020 [Verrucomicrobiota bacterium]
MPDSEHSNPYAPPTGEPVTAPAISKARREGKHLVVPKGWISPPVCLFTGAAAPLTPLRQARLSYIQPAWWLFLLLGPLVMILISLFATRMGNIYYVIKEDLARRHRRRLIINWAIFLASGPLAVGVYEAVPAELMRFSARSFGFGIFLLLVPGLILLILSAVLSRTWCRLIKTAKIEGNFIWLSGIPADAQAIILRCEEERFSRKQVKMLDPLPGATGLPRSHRSNGNGYIREQDSPVRSAPAPDGNAHPL